MSTKWTSLQTQDMSVNRPLNSIMSGQAQTLSWEVGQGKIDSGLNHWAQVSGPRPLREDLWHRCRDWYNEQGQIVYCSQGYRDGVPADVYFFHTAQERTMFLLRWQ